MFRFFHTNLLMRNLFLYRRAMFRNSAASCSQTLNKKATSPSQENSTSWKFLARVVGHPQGRTFSGNGSRLRNLFQKLSRYSYSSMYRQDCLLRLHALAAVRGAPCRTLRTNSSNLFRVTFWKTVMRRIILDLQRTPPSSCDITAVMLIAFRKPI